MPNHVAHFAIHADDVERARAFYEAAFGWEFTPWGPPGFYLISTGPGGLRGALQQRREPVTGTGTTGFECTISVEDVEAARRAVEDAGGTVTAPPFTIDGVGTLFMFTDTEGNTVGAMRYEPGVEQSDHRSTS